MPNRDVDVSASITETAATTRQPTPPVASRSLIASWSMDGTDSTQHSSATALIAFGLLEIALLVQRLHY